MPSPVEDSLALYDKTRRQQAGLGGPAIRDPVLAAQASRAAGLEFQKERLDRELSLRERALNLEEERSRYQQTMQEAKRQDEALSRSQAASAMSELIKLNVAEPDFDSKVADILNKNPYASSDGNVTRFLQDRSGIRQTLATRQAARKEQEQAEAALQAQGLEPKSVSVSGGQRQVTYGAKPSAKEEALRLLKAGVLKDETEYKSILALPNEEEQLLKLGVAEGAHASELAATKMKMQQTNATLRQLQAALKAVPATDTAKQKELMNQILSLQLGDEPAEEIPENSRAKQLGIQ